MRHNRPGAAGQANKFARAALCERLYDESRPNLVARAGVNHSALTHNNRGAAACPLFEAFPGCAIALPAPITSTDNNRVETPLDSGTIVGEVVRHLRGRILQSIGARASFSCRHQSSGSPLLRAD